MTIYFLPSTAPPVDDFFFFNMMAGSKSNIHLVEDALKQLVAEGKITVKNEGDPAPWQAIVEHADK